MSYQVVGIGNALVDVQVQIDDSLIEKFGFTKGGMTLLEAKEQGALLEQLSSYGKNICSGGSAANTIHGIGALGGRAYYIGKVANDEYGRHYSEDMADCEVGFPGPDSPEEGTGTSVILITPDAQRTMVTHLGISIDLHSENVDETILKGAKYVYVEGYLFTGEETRNAAIKLAKAAKKEGIPVAFTLSDAFVVNSFKEHIEEFVEWHTDILFCNEVEGCALAGSDDPEEAFTKLRAQVDQLFFTRGKDGAMAASGHEEARVRSFPVDAVDTTGAGDLFAAGALYGMLHGHSLEECAILGGYCASQVITHLGARLPAHSHKNTAKIIEEYQNL